MSQDGIDTCNQFLAADQVRGHSLAGAAFQMCETELSENGEKDDGRHDENYHCSIRDRDDKWAFPRSVLDRIARENRAEVLTMACTTMSASFGCISAIS